MQQCCFARANFTGECGEALAFVDRKQEAGQRFAMSPAEEEEARIGVECKRGGPKTVKCVVQRHHCRLLGSYRTSSAGVTPRRPAANFLRPQKNTFTNTRALWGCRPMASIAYRPAATKVLRHGSLIEQRLSLRLNGSPVAAEALRHAGCALSAGMDEAVLNSPDLEWSGPVHRQSRLAYPPATTHICRSA